MLRLKLFYPIMALLLGLLIVLGLCASSNKSLASQDWLDALAVGYIAVFILSMLEGPRIVTILALVCGYGIVRQDDAERFPMAKGSLIAGKQWNIVLTAAINLTAGIFRLVS